MDTPAIEQTYQADPLMLHTIIKTVTRLKRDCYICDVVLLVYTSYFYNKYANDINLFIYWEAGMVLFLGFLQYTLIASKGRFINRTAIEVNISEDQYLIKTAAFKGPFWFRRESMEVKLNKAATKATTILNPYPAIFKDDKQITRLRHKNREFYVFHSYYNWRLEADLHSGE